jgi:hypothetical protein
VLRVLAELGVLLVAIPSDEASEARQLLDQILVSGAPKPTP